MQGQEEQALAYFKGLLEKEPSKEERANLEELIVRLEREIKQNRARENKNVTLTVQNLPSNCLMA
jgi:uncharacterized FlgJ-related protein